MIVEKTFNEKFNELEEYYNINSPDEIREQIKKNENIFLLLDEIKPYLEESFSDANYTLEMNFEPECDNDKFIILRLDVSQERFNNGIGDEIRELDSKIWDFRRNINVIYDLFIMPGIADV